MIEKTLRISFRFPIGYVKIALLCSTMGSSNGQRNASGHSAFKLVGTYQNK